MTTPDGVGGAAAVVATKVLPWLSTRTAPGAAAVITGTETGMPLGSTEPDVKLPKIETRSKQQGKNNVKKESDDQKTKIKKKKYKTKTKKKYCLENGENIKLHNLSTNRHSERADRFSQEQPYGIELTENSGTAIKTDKSNIKQKI
uniref:Uncharacterized protein n=1 Tax=Romanomermis culicivorax TaxID=13658 RepID=A0A915K9P9_ROMCU